MKKFLLLPFLFVTATVCAQYNPLAFFEPLMGRTWSAEGVWENGSGFRQEINFEYSLDSTLVLVKSKGFTDKQQTTFGPRNHGIRKYDPNSKSIQFWEFDVFGSVTKGMVKQEGNDIRYTYTYGETQVTDLWEFVDKDTYTFKVGEYVGGNWTQTYLTTEFNAIGKQGYGFQFDHQSLVVKNLKKAGDFYRDVFGFEEIPHPERKPGFRWFNIYGKSQLHLIKKEVVEFKKDKSIHLCLSTKNLEHLIERLMEKEITFYDWPGNVNSVTDRADGVQQIYIQDPEGYWIEINNAPH